MVLKSGVSSIQLLSYTEINVFESVASVGTKETLLSLRVMNSGVSS